MADKRGEIERAATRAIRRDGLRSVSFRTLADEVGVKSSSVHYHFRTKDDLAEAVIRSYTEAFGDALRTIEQDETTLVGKIDAFNALFADVVATDDICLCGMMAAEVTSLDTPAQAALREFFEISEAWLERAFESHRDELKAGLTPRELAAIFMSGLEGATLVDRVDSSGERLGAYRALARAVVA